MAPANLPFPIIDRRGNVRNVRYCKTVSGDSGRPDLSAITKPILRRDAVFADARAIAQEAKMAQAERRRAQQETAANSAEAAQTTKKVVSAMATGGDAWMEGQAELIEQADQMSQRWMQSQREAIDATRQSMLELQRARDLGDIMRVQQEWLAGTWQRLAGDLQALTLLALQYQRRTMNWAGEAAESAGEQMRRGEHAVLSAAGAKPGSEGRRD
jgi:hypothetical protein